MTHAHVTRLGHASILVASTVGASGRARTAGSRASFQPSAPDRSRPSLLSAPFICSKRRPLRRPRSRRRRCAPRCLRPRHDWVLTFPKARYLMGRTEYEYWEQKHRLEPELPVNQGSFEDSVLPVMAAGQAEFVDTDHCLFDDRRATLRFVPAPGHTIGNMMVDLGGGEDRAVMSGAVIHHPIQCAAPWLANAADFDPAAALATRSCPASAARRHLHHPADRPFSGPNRGARGFSSPVVQV